ncbi:hypothetical protein [Methylovulum miyakonense]|uniref:hypothetical protein n=1 Tax=Methylovulum miyakonense TaxID=645578 RepID=UPI00037447D7|nr:hypothetical protein [Methylovulum miyakonense]
MDILKIRVEALHSNLNKISGHLQAIPDPRVDLNELDKYLNGAVTLLKNSKKIVSHARIDSEDDAPGISQDLKTAEEDLDKTKQELTKAISIVESMRNKCFRIQDRDIGKKIAEDVRDRTKPCIAALDEIEIYSADPKQEWDKFSKTIDKVNESIFAEYIEFLGGLAMRDRGFDEDISQIADGLIRIYSSTRDNIDPIAIPTREQAVNISLTRVIRVTFPDWSIWTLPSTAHEFWHVMAQDELKDRLQLALRKLTGNKKDTIQPYFYNCLADAFATYTMGPAYPYYAIFLLLSPCSPYTAKSTDAADDIRVYAMCQMLACMDSKESALELPYAKVRACLDKVWADAIAETSAKPTEKQKTRIEQDKKRACELVKTLWEVLLKSSYPLFTSDVWRTIEPWATLLRNGKVDEIQVPQGAELRHVLNAAWLARVDPMRNPDVDITAAAKNLANRINERQY